MKALCELLSGRNFFLAFMVIFCHSGIAQDLQPAPFPQVTGFDTTRLNSYRAKPEYQYQQKKPEESFFKRAMRSLKEFLLSLFEREEGIGQNALKLILVLGAVILLIYFFLNSRWQALFDRGNRKSRTSMTIFNEEIPTTSLDEKITAAIRAGDYRTAFRWKYIDLIHKLDRAGILKILPQKTNTDYIRDVQSLPIRDNFTFLAHAFDYAWYGEYSVSPSEYDRYHTMITEILQKNGSKG